MSRIAVFPGSFDPITIGHEDIARRALPLFDELIIGIGSNSDKRYLHTAEERKSMLEMVFSNEKRIRVMIYSGLTIDFCRSVGANHLLRGLRTSADFEFERGIAQMNKELAEDIETVFMISRPKYSHIASSIVRDIHRNKGDVSAFIPKGLKL